MSWMIKWGYRSSFFLFIFTFAFSTFAEFKKFGDSSLNTVDGIYVVHSSGDAYTMAYDSSFLFGDKVMEGVVPYMGEKITNVLVGVIPLNIPEGIITFLSDLLFNRPLIANLKQREMDMLRGLAEGTSEAGYELPLSVARRAYVAPEVIQLLVTKAINFGLIPGIFGTQNYGCSSVIALPEVTGSDKTLFIRGQDYPGIGHFDRFPTVFYAEPDDGYRFVSINSLGLSTTPLTAVNDQGLAMAIHVILTSDNNSNGDVIFSVLEEMIRKAKTIEEAYAIVGNATHVSGWQINITDIYEGRRRAAVIEISGSETKLIMREETSVVSNMYFSDSLKEKEIYLSQGVYLHDKYRIVRMNQLVEQYRGHLDIEKGVEILRDNYDVETEIWTSYSPNIIAAVDQVKALVFELGDNPSDTVIWVSNGLAPSSQGTFYAFPFASFFQDGRIRAEELSTIPARPRSEPGLDSPGFEGYEDFKKAYLAYDEDSDATEALNHMRIASEKDNSDWYRLAVAFFTLKLGNAEEAKDLLSLFGRQQPTGASSQTHG